MDGRPARTRDAGGPPEDGRASAAEPAAAPFRRDPCIERRKPRRCEHG